MIKLTPKEFDEARKYFCFPLDGLGTSDEVAEIIKELEVYVGVFKIGLELYTEFGPQIIELVKRLAPDSKIFLDLKLFDIPATVKGTAYRITKKGVDIFNIHASGGEEMMEAAIEGAKQAIAENPELKMPEIIGVTALTSFDEKAYRKVYGMSVEASVENLAKMSKDAGLDGIVSSAKDLTLDFVKKIKENSPGFTFITPGISLPKEDGGIRVGYDQKRVTDPESAIKDGSTMIVIGRAVSGGKTVEERRLLSLKVLEGINSGLNILAF